MSAKNVSMDNPPIMVNVHVKQDNTRFKEAVKHVLLDVLPALLKFHAILVLMDTSLVQDLSRFARVVLKHAKHALIHQLVIPVMKMTTSFLRTNNAQAHALLELMPMLTLM